MADNAVAYGASDDGPTAQSSWSGLILVLIHGTWGAKAKWVQEDSLFCKVLLGKLPAETRIFPFFWSGRNHHTARLKAADQLKSLIGKYSREWPKGRIILLAHSHGGNIAYYALRDLKDRSRVAGIVTMGTPFISMSTRDIFGGEPELLKFHGCLIYLFIMLLLWGLLSSLFMSSGLMSVLNPKFGAFVIVSLGLFTFFLGLSFSDWVGDTAWRSIQNWASEKQHEISKKFVLSGFENISALSLAINRDEAFIWLRIVRWLASLPSTIFQLVAWSANAYTVLIAIGCLLLGMWMAIEFRGVSFIAGMGGLMAVVPIVLLALWCVSLLLYPFVIIVPKIIRSHFLGFGSESVLANLIADITVEKHAPGRWDRVERYDIRASMLDRKRIALIALNHSQIYNSPQIVEKIATWIRLQL